MENEQLCPQAQTVFMVLLYLCLITGPTLLQSSIVGTNPGTELAANYVLVSGLIQIILTLYGGAAFMRKDPEEADLSGIQWYVVKLTPIPASYALSPLPSWFFTNIFCMSTNIAVIPTYTFVLTFVPVPALLIGLFIGCQTHRVTDTPI